MQKYIKVDTVKSGHFKFSNTLVQFKGKVRSKLLEKIKNIHTPQFSANWSHTGFASSKVEAWHFAEG